MQSFELVMRFLSDEQIAEITQISVISPSDVELLSLKRNDLISVLIMADFLFMYVYEVYLCVCMHLLCIILCIKYA